MSSLDLLKELFATSPPDSPPPTGMTFEQRAVLIAELHRLQERGNQTEKEWIAQIHRTLGYADATRPFAAALDPSSELTDKTIRGVVASALRFVEAHPVAAFGGDVRYLIAQTVEATLAKSVPARAL